MDKTFKFICGCGREVHECICGVPDMPPDFKEECQGNCQHYSKPCVYINHCWNCGSTINSLFCLPSATPGMGYHCKKCGKDLTEWKMMRGLL